jgi:hypothetical protein
MSAKDSIDWTSGDPSILGPASNSLPKPPHEEGGQGGIGLGRVFCLSDIEVKEGCESAVHSTLKGGRKADLC